MLHATAKWHFITSQRQRRDAPPTATATATAIAVEFVSAGSENTQGRVKTNLFDSDGAPLTVFKTYKRWPCEERLV